MKSIIKYHNKEKGLTLVELMIALALSMIIITSIVVLVRYGQDYMFGTETQVDVQQNARVGLDLMVRELRLARSFVNILNSLVTFRADIQGINDTVEYAYDPGTHQLTRNLNGTTAFPLAENVKVAGLSFKYYTYDATTGGDIITSDPSKVNRVLVYLSIQSHVDKSFDGKTRTYTLTADVTPRNMNTGSTTSTTPPPPPTPTPGTPFLMVTADPEAPTSVRADGVAYATIVGSLWDDTGTPAPNQDVTLNAAPSTGSGTNATFDNNLPAITLVTDGSGRVSARLKSTRCDGVNFGVWGTGGGVTSLDVFVRFFQGPPAVITVAATPSQLLACQSGSTPPPVAVTATVVDACGQIVADGTPVTFSADPAAGVTFNPVSGNTSGGVVSTSLSRTITTPAPNFKVTATSGSTPGSGDLSYKAGPPYGTISLSINPTRVKADGLEQATISAIVSDQCGNPVADGTKVTLTTTLGFFVGATTNPTQIELNTVNGIVTAYIKSANQGNAVITAQSTATVLGVSGTATGTGTVIFTAVAAYILLSSDTISQGDNFQVYIFDPKRTNGVTAEGLNSPYWWAHDCTQSGADDDPFVVLERNDTGVFMVSEDRYGAHNYIETGTTASGAGNLWEVILKTGVNDVVTVGYNSNGQAGTNGDNTWCTSIQAEAQAQLSVNPISLSYVVNSQNAYGNEVLFKIKSGASAPLTITGMTVEWTDISDLGFSVTNDWSEGPYKPLLGGIWFIESDVSDPWMVSKVFWHSWYCPPLVPQSSPATINTPACDSFVLTGSNQVATVRLSFAYTSTGPIMSATQFKIRITYQYGGQTHTNTIIFLSV